MPTQRVFFDHKSENKKPLSFFLLRLLFRLNDSHISILEISSWFDLLFHHFPIYCNLIQWLVRFRSVFLNYSSHVTTFSFQFLPFWRSLSVLNLFKIDFSLRDGPIAEKASTRKGRGTSLFVNLFFCLFVFFSLKKNKLLNLGSNVVGPLYCYQEWTAFSSYYHKLDGSCTYLLASFERNQSCGSFCYFNRAFL